MIVILYQLKYPDLRHKKGLWNPMSIKVLTLVDFDMFFFLSIFHLGHKSRTIRM